MTLETAYCPRCNADYIPILSIRGCPWHTTPRIEPRPNCTCGRPVEKNHHGKWRTTCSTCRKHAAA